MPYDPELQMLREFYQFFAPQLRCFFCNEPLALPFPKATFGHRRHTKVWERNFTVHHQDEDRSNNNLSNLKGCHSTCHRRFHKTLLEKGGHHAGKEKGKEVPEETVTREVIQ